MSLTPEILDAVKVVAKKLMGYSEDIQTTIDDLADDGLIPFGYNEAPQAFFAYLDTRVWRCASCDIWHPMLELDDEENCTGCRRSPAEREDDQ